MLEVVTNVVGVQTDQQRLKRPLSYNPYLGNLYDQLEWLRNWAMGGAGCIHAPVCIHLAHKHESAHLLKASLLRCVIASKMVPCTRLTATGGLEY